MVSAVRSRVVLLQVAISCNLSIYIVEYIKGLRKREIQVENITYVVDLAIGCWYLCVLIVSSDILP